MATSLIHYGKHMKRTESRKSHSWWWDSHVSTKNSKWLSENLEEMDKSVKRMLKLIEEEGDSFAKKAEMYYQRRPELVSHVEEFYRMYRSLAERYDHVTGELRKSIPSDLHSQTSTVSDSSSDLPSPLEPQRSLGRRKSGTRAAGFDFFLGPDGSQRADDESSTLTDSEADSDDSSINSYSVVSGGAGDHALQRKIMELELELRDVKEKLRAHDQGRLGDSYHPRIEWYEKELAIASEEISRLNDLREPRGTEAVSSDVRAQGSVEELRIAKGKLRVSENEIASLRYELERNKDKIRQLQTQLESGHKEVISSKAKLNAEKREVSKLSERVSRLKSSLSDRDREIMDLKIAVSDAEEKIFPEKRQVKAEISKLIEERVRLVDHVRELENQGRCFEDEIRMIKAERSEMEARLNVEIASLKKDSAEKGYLIESLRTERDNLISEISTLNAEAVRRDDRIDRLGKELSELQKERLGLVAEANGMVKHAEDLESRTTELEKEIERQRALISDGAEEKREAIRQLCFSIEHYRYGYYLLRQALTGHKEVAVLTS